MQTQPLQVLAQVSRQGSLLEEKCLSHLHDLAATVKRIAEEEYWAPDATSAAAWVLRLAHQNADLTGMQTDLLQGLSPRPKLLAFRGQPAKYTFLAPSISRVAREFRKQNDIAISWMRVGLQLWADAKFRFVSYDDLRSGDHQYHLDSLGDVQPVAQHYGLATNLIDWTWDPLTAICFASHRLNVGSGDLKESSGRVCIRAIHPESKEQAMLPPSFATRVWQQRGLFQYQPDPTDVPLIIEQLGGLGQIAAARQEVRSYPNIVFNCTVGEQMIAKEIIERLLLEKDPLFAITRWARCISEEFPEYPSRSLLFLPDRKSMEEGLPTEFIHGFAEIIDASDDLLEDPILMTEYVDSVALRQATVGKRYDAWGLYLLAKAMTDRHCLCRISRTDSNSSLGHLQRFMSRPDFHHALLKGGQLGAPPLWP